MKYAFSHIWKNKAKIIVLAIIFWQWCFSHTILARGETLQGSKTQAAEVKTAPAPRVQYTKKLTITAYSSTVDQTDSTPCVTANGYNLCQNNKENVIAANFLPLGTKIRIPEHFGGRVFTVQDRMNARYYYRADVWMQTRQKAKEFGIKYAEIEVLK